MQGVEGDFFRIVLRPSGTVFATLGCSMGYTIGTAFSKVCYTCLADGTWDEDTINWNNYPNHDAANSQVTGTGTSYLGTLTFGAEGWRVLEGESVTDYVNEQLSGDKVASFMLIDQAQGGQLVQIDSKKSENKPYFTIKSYRRLTPR